MLYVEGNVPKSAVALREARPNQKVRTGFMQVGRGPRAFVLMDQYDMHQIMTLKKGQELYTEGGFLGVKTVIGNGVSAFGAVHVERFEIIEPTDWLGRKKPPVARWFDAQWREVTVPVANIRVGQVLRVSY
jgi:hypothetical protein